MKKTLALAIAIMFVAAPALAFHDGGVAHCNGCHTMHNSQDGVLVDPDSPAGNQNLLVDANPSDVCLGCHAMGLGAVFGNDPLAPPAQKGAGNFTFLLEDNLNDGHNGAIHPIPGEAAGHSIVAPSMGVGADGTLTTAPGGTFPASVLGCTSCHDPHGNQDFRMLNGIGSVQDGLHTFTAAAPVASGLSIFFGAEAPDNHTAYESGMSAWCGNCHGDFHASGDLVHPAGVAMSGTTVPRYNTYGGTSNIGGGVFTSAYLPEVPFEQVGNTTSQTDGALSGAQVSCMTCHRAHATSAPDAGRWDFSVTRLHEDGVESGSYAIPDPFNDLSQRSLCNKCHTKDRGDAPFTP